MTILNEDAPTMAEVVRRLVRIEAKMDDWAGVSIRITNLEQRTAQNDARRWQVWLALGAALIGVPMSVLASIIAAVLLGKVT